MDSRSRCPDGWESMALPTTMASLDASAPEAALTMGWQSENEFSPPPPVVVPHPRTGWGRRTAEANNVRNTWTAVGCRTEEEGAIIKINAIRIAATKDSTPFEAALLLRFLAAFGSFRRNSCPRCAALTLTRGDYDPSRGAFQAFAPSHRSRFASRHSPPRGANGKFRQFGEWRELQIYIKIAGSSIILLESIAINASRIYL